MIVIHICVLPFFFAKVRFAAWLSVAMRAADAFALLAFATTTLAGPNRKHRGHKNQCIKRLDCWLTIFLVLLAVVLAAGYYAYCVYGKSKRTDKETEPLMPVATATPMA